MASPRRIPRFAVRFRLLRRRLLRQWDYCSRRVWHDTRSNWRVNTIKTINLTVRSFMSADLQSKACALTYRTLLALVPALALMCAIGRGFGLQQDLEEMLIRELPSQAKALTEGFRFVDAYLAESSGGLFVGVGVIFLLSTLIMLVRNVEHVFNDIWLVPKGRNVWRMLSDYLAIFLILPILLICASGLSLFMQTSLSRLLPFGFLQPAIELLFDLVSLMLSWLFFAATYMLIPNTRVKFRSAIIPGILVGTSCQVVQWLFVTGQLYVAKYNAIYGSFSFLPLLLIWMQLVWLFTLIGAQLCFSIQNIGEYNFGENIRNISENYRRQATIAVMAIIARRFMAGRPALSMSRISQQYRLPINLVTPIVHRLKCAGLVSFVDIPEKEQNEQPVQPARDVSTLTVAAVNDAMQRLGDNDFLPEFDRIYASVVAIDDKMLKAADTAAADTLVKDLEINLQSLTKQ